MRVGFVRNVGLGMVALVGLGLAGCDDSPTDFDNAQTVKIFTNPSSMVIPAGKTALLESRTENAGDEPTFEEITPAVDASCGAGAVAIDVAASFEPSIQPPGRFDVTGGTTVGTTCINLSGGGASAVVEVTVVGDSLQILNAVDSIFIGDTLNLSSLLMADDGTPVTPFNSATDVVFSTDADTVVSVTADGIAVGVGAGAATLTATYTSAGAVVTDQVTITVIALPPVLTSTDVGSADAGDVITITGTGIIPSAHVIFIDGVQVDPFFEPTLVDATTATVRMTPGDNAPASITIGVPGDVSNALSVTRTGNTEPANDASATAPLVTLPWEEWEFVDGSSDDRFMFTLAAPATLDLMIDWTGDADIDLLVTDFPVTAFVCTSTATSAHPEVGQCSLGAGTYIIRVNSYDGVGANFRANISIAP